MATEAKSLITMEGTKLVLKAGLELPNPNVRVLSIVGKARMGKSTFLNAIVSKYRCANSSVFSTSGGVKHCTFGINYCFIPEQNLLLLDSQGLANGDARHDPALLLFIYLVSNVVIFNDTKILQNEALKLIEPICTFATYIDYDTFVKPLLIFRLSDGKLVENTDENLEQVMEHHPDQYQSIRESIEEVFTTPIRLVKTETLDRSDERYLDSGDYLGLLGVSENGFDATITAIMDLVKKSELRTNVLSKLSEIVEQINNNDKITLEKLDVVGLVHKNDVLEWVQNVSPLLKATIEVDGTEACYQERVLQRQQEVDAKLKEFDKKFKSVSASIKREQKKKLKTAFDEPILIATAEGLAKAKLLVKSRVDGLGQFKASLNSDLKSFISKQDESLKDCYLAGFHRLFKECAPLVKPIRTFYEQWTIGINDEFLKAIKTCKDQEAVERSVVISFYQAKLDNYDSFVQGRINSLTDTLITSEQFMNECLNACRDDFKAFIASSVNKRSASFSMRGDSLVSSIELLGPASYNSDIVSDLYAAFDEALLRKKDHQMSALIEKKEQLLFSSLFTNPISAKQIQLKNPEIQFAWDSILLGTLIKDTGIKQPYMTVRTWSSIYEPMYISLTQKLIKKGVFKEGFTPIVKEGDNIYTTKCKDMYDSNCVDLFLCGLKKLYCQMIVKGTEFPAALD